MVDGLFSREASAAAARSLFATDAPPDAIFVGNDHMAFAVIEVLRHELGLDIPEEVSIVGYDDVTLAAWDSFQLTTVRQPANRMVEAAVEHLLDRIASSETKPERIEIDGPLIIRKSARIPKGWKE